MKLEENQENSHQEVNLSVIVAVYNVEKFLPACLESLRSQTIKNVEFLIIDDGSTDSCVSICDQYRHLDDRFIVIHQPNRGSLIARKRGIELARGEWCVFIDGDDFLPSNKVLSIELSLAEANNVDMLRFGVDVISESPGRDRSFLHWRGDFQGKVLSSYEIISKIFEQENAVSWTIWDKIYRTSVLKRTLPFIKDDLYLPCATDLYHMFLIGFFSTTLCSLDTEPLYTYRYGVGVSTGDITLPKYQRYAQEPKLVNKFASFLKEQSKLEEYKPVLDTLRLRLIKGAVDRYLRMEKVNSAEGFDCLISGNQIGDVVDALYAVFRNRVSELAEKIYGSATMQSKPHRVKVVAVYYQAYNIGGVQRVVSKHLSMFLSLGYRVILITDRVEEQEFAVPDGVTRVILPGSYEEGRSSALAKVIKDYDIDLILHNNSSAHFLLFDIIVIKSLGCGVIVQSHELTTQPLVYSSTWFKNKPAVFRLADAVIVLSLMELNFYKGLGVPAYYIPNPISVNAEFNEKCDRFQQERNTNLVLWVGRLENNQKNYNEAMDILKNVAREESNVICYVVGRGNQTDYDFILEYIRKNGLGSQIKLVKECPNPEKYYKIASVLLMTSSYESFSMVVAESKSFGVPLVTYEMPYLELLKDQKGYFSVPRHDKNAAGMKILQLLRNDSLREKLSREARQSIEDFVENTPNQLWYWKNLISKIVQTPGAEVYSIGEEQQNLNLLFWNTTASFVQDGINRKNGEINRLKREKEAIKKNWKSSIAETEKLKQAKLEVERKLKDSSSREKLVEGELKASLLREESLKQSVSFRTGRTITWLPRKVRGGIRCFRQHGLVYTVNRFCWHIRHLS